MPRGRVRRVIDGDTFQLGGGEYVRIAGLNAPELRQRGGLAAKRRLRSRIPRGTEVGLSRPVAKSYGRVVRRVTVNRKAVNKLVANPKPRHRRK
jgi:endonuclease YncB( thermonuclease family)